MEIEEFKKLPIIGILRGIFAEDVFLIVETSIASGLKTIEITMNTDGAPGLIRKMVGEAKGCLTVGAGTVLNVEEAKVAIDAGATFIVSPILDIETVLFCNRNNIPVFPGALTPQEIFEAWEAGATMVKVFPSKFFGPSYFKEIKGPFNQIELLACGGVNADNVGEFFQCGASAVAFGASIFRKDWLAKKQFNLIKEEMQKLIEAVRFF